MVLLAQQRVATGVVDASSRLALDPRFPRATAHHVVLVCERHVRLAKGGILHQPRLVHLTREARPRPAKGELGRIRILDMAPRQYSEHSDGEDRHTRAHASSRSTCGGRDVGWHTGRSSLLPSLRACLHWRHVRSNGGFVYDSTV